MVYKKKKVGKCGNICEELIITLFIIKGDPLHIFSILYATLHIFLSTSRKKGGKMACLG